MKKAIYIKGLSAAFLLASTWLLSCNGVSSSVSAAADSADNEIEMSSGDSGSMQAIVTITGTLPDTTVSGTVIFDQVGSKVKMHLELTIPAEENKNVAVHIHAMGDCGDMGKMAGGHWNPTHENHGKWGSSSYHSGDIGNVSLDGNGKGTLDMETDRWSVGGDSTTNILGKTIIVHGGMDDYTSQPAGNAGGRIGCGVIKKS